MSEDVVHRLASALAPDYELGPEIGRGGMGMVFRATDTRLHRDVAIKLLPPEFADNPESRERFVFEARLAAGLNHPNIVPILDVAERDGLVWYVMTLVDGESLRARVQRDGPLTSPQTARILREVVWALDYAHARGIVHRDIKPDNILLENGTGRALVTDFGIAQLTGEEPAGDPVRAGAVMGSLMYMAPEQATGTEQLDGRADIYSLGLTAYYLLAGHQPFERATILTVAARIATGRTPDWDDVEQEIDRPLLHLLEQCVEPDRDQRWESAGQMLEALGPQALAPRPMPASIRRLVRDFMLVPTFGFIVLVVSLITEDVTLGEFIGWMTLVLAVNFGITLRAFTRRGFRWGDLRDGLEMEFARQAEELEATGALRERFKAIVFLATWASISGGLVNALIQAHIEPVVPLALGVAALAVPFSMPITWLQVKIYTFFGRLGLKLLPSLPRPESPGRFSRMADTLLTRLFRPLGSRQPETPALTVGSTGWRSSDLRAARRSTQSIDDLLAELPAEEQLELRSVRAVARDLTATIESLRSQKAGLERQREQELESLGASSRQAAVVLERLRHAVEDCIDGQGDASKIRHALSHARELLAGGSSDVHSEDKPVRRRRSLSNWLGVALEASVTGRAAYDEEATGVRELSNQVSRRLDESVDLRTSYPELGESIQPFIRSVRNLEAEMLLRAQRGGSIEPASAESLTESEEILAELEAALDRYESQGDTERLEELVVRARTVHDRIRSSLPGKVVR